MRQGGEHLRGAIHIEVAQASLKAIEAVEAKGGTVTCMHYNRLALRALLKPEKFVTIPRRARPPPRLMDYYTSDETRGEFSPFVQLRKAGLLAQGGAGGAATE